MSKSDFQDILDAGITRRTFMNKSTQFGLAAFVLGGPLGLTACSSKKSLDDVIAKSIPISTEDTITLAEEYDWYSVVSWGDPLFPQVNEFDDKNPSLLQNSRFGDNNDGMSLMSVGDKHVLVVNNEYTNIEMIFPNGPDSEADILNAKAAFGVSIVEVEKTEQGWQPVIEGKLNRRITMETPMEIRGPARGHPFMRTSTDPLGVQSLGTWSNCGNGQTPWGTYLTCEENFNLSFNSSDREYESSTREVRYGLGVKSQTTSRLLPFYKYDKRFDLSKEPNEPNRVGYIVEIDPSDPSSTPVKHTALGRMMHENAEMTISKAGYVVVYMGDDARGEYLYKFVSKHKYVESNGKKNSRLLEEGTLYVARFGEADEDLSGRGEWVELTYGKNGLTIENGFSSQAEVCIKTRMAASVVGGTTMDRPEWVAAHPDKIEVCCALTNNVERNVKPNKGGDPQDLNGPNRRSENLYGQIVRWHPDKEDHANLTFNWDLFVLAGNPLVHQGANAGSSNVTRENMFNSPDGLMYDTQGRLWIQTDGKFHNQGDFEGMGNNQMLVADSNSGEINRFMVGPKGSEITGLTWSPDRKTMFVGIQHPGIKGATSTFPHGEEGKTPRSSVIGIYRKDGKAFV